jgi:hypothetical protein
VIQWGEFFESRNKFSVFSFQQEGNGLKGRELARKGKRLETVALAEEVVFPGLKPRG